MCKDKEIFVNVPWFDDWQGNNNTRNKALSELSGNYFQLIKI